MRWLKIADREDDCGGTAAGGSDVQLRELRKRNKLLEQERDLAACDGVFRA